MILYSDELVSQQKGKALHANQRGGKVRYIGWDFASLPAGTVGDRLICAQLRKHERVIQGMEFHSAHPGAFATYGTHLVVDLLEVRGGECLDRFLAPTDFSTAGQTALAGQERLGVGRGVLYECPEDVWLVCRNSGAPFATGGRIAGYLLVVAD
jgi:hypothetical protein